MEQHRPSHATPIPFVGRQDELAVLREAIAAAADHGGRIVLVSGDPGIGKTRLATELASSFRSTEVEVHWGRCWEGEGAPAFWPWIQILRSCLTAREPNLVVDALGDAAADLAALAPEIQPWLTMGAPAVSPAADPDEARFRLFDAVTRLVRRIACDRPLLLILDDLHRADVASLVLLQFLASELRWTPVVVLGTYRDLEIDRHHPLARSLADLDRYPFVEHLTLGGLSAPEVRTLIESGLSGRTRDALLGAVYERTQGNPLFVSEIVRLLRGSGDDALAELRRSMPRVPETIREAIGQRLARLSEGSRDVLRTAAVIGREFDGTLLERATGVDRAELLGAIDEAVAAQLVAEIARSLGRYRFAHVLTRDVLYDGIATTERAAHHRRIAVALEELCREDVAPHLGALALHFFEAARDGDPDQAIDYALRAAKRALGLLAYEEAVEHFERALAGLERKRAGVRAISETLLGLGDACRRAGAIREARAAFERAAAAARSGAMPDVLARAALGIGEPWVVGVPAGDLAALLHEAMDALDPSDSALRARLLGGLALASPDAPLARRDALSAEAVAMAERIDDRDARIFALTARQLAVWTSLNTAEAIGHARALLHACAECGDDETAVRVHLTLVRHLLEVGDVAAGWQHLEESDRLAAKLRQPRALWQVSLLRTMRTLLRGHFDEAERLSVATLDLGRRSDTVLAEQNFVAQIFVIRREQDRTRELISSCEALVERYPGVPVWRSALIVALAEGGEEEAARTALAGAIHDLPAVPDDFHRLATLCLLADAVVLLGERDHAPEIRAALAPYGTRHLMVGAGAVCNGAVARQLGGLASLLELWDEGERWFENALRANTELGSPPQIAHARYGHARLLLARRWPGDAQRAAPLVAGARATAAQLGMAGLLARIDALGSEATSADPAARPEDNSMRREGQFWTMSFDGKVVRLRDLKGLHYIADLLRQPGRDIHVLALVAAVDPEQVEPAPGKEGSSTERDVARGERARIRVRNDIARALRSVRDHHEGLWRHLDGALKTGTFCAYRPAAAVVWDV